MWSLRGASPTRRQPYEAPTLRGASPTSCQKSATDGARAAAATVLRTTPQSRTPLYRPSGCSSRARPSGIWSNWEPNWTRTGTCGARQKRLKNGRVLLKNDLVFANRPQNNQDEHMGPQKIGITAGMLGGRLSNSKTLVICLQNSLQIWQKVLFKRVSLFWDAKMTFLDQSTCLAPPIFLHENYFFKNMYEQFGGQLARGLKTFPIFDL